MNRRWLGIAVAFSLVVGSVALADIPVESRRPTRAAGTTEPFPLTIKYEAISKLHPGVEARMVIPKKVLLQVIKQNSVYVGGNSLDEPNSIPWTTVIAGVALSLAAASSLWVLRRREARLVAAAALLVVVSCGAWNLAHGDLLVPGGKGPRRPPGNPNAPRPQPTILIETTDEGDSVTLILKPRDQ